MDADHITKTALKWVGIPVVIGFLTILAGIFLFQDRLIYPAHRVPPLGQDFIKPADVVEITVDSPDGPVTGWWLAAQNQNADHPGPAVVFLHGNAERREPWAGVMAPYRALGVGVFIPEYRGYGAAPGNPSADAIVSDVKAMVDLLAERPDVDNTKIVYHGRSLGGGIACALAEKLPPMALILNSTFTSLADMATHFGLPGFLVLDRLDSIETLGHFEGPVLVQHGRHDRLIPIEQGRELAKAARNGRFIEYSADHNDMPYYKSTFWNDIYGFGVEIGWIARMD